MCLRMERLAQYPEKKAEQEAYAREHPVLSSAGTVIASPLQSVEYGMMSLLYAGHSDPQNLDTYIPIDTTAMTVTNYVVNTRNAVSKEIAENTNWEIFGNNVAAFLYNTGMSLADSMTCIAAFGPAAPYVIGGGTAAQTLKDVAERGGSNRQAIVCGLAVGTVEAVLEKAPVDEVIKILGTGEVGSVKTLIKNVFKQANLEFTEEGLTEIADILIDTAIMGDNSNFANRVSGYMANGLSEGAAKKQALLDCAAQVGRAALAGYISGGVIGGVASKVNYNANAQAGKTNPVEGTYNLGAVDTTNGTQNQTVAHDIRTDTDVMSMAI
ncbi:MAG: hypothetical protein LUG13_05685 [Oscillospiraceae bacterium]|nr:hypothetical protein [Oscillospiraceae bacterium]